MAQIMLRVKRDVFPDSDPGDFTVTGRWECFVVVDRIARAGWCSVGDVPVWERV